MVSNDLLTSLTSKALCEKLRSSGAKILGKVAQIFEEQEIDGDDLTLLTYEELSQLLPKLGMRKKLERFVRKLGFKLVTMPEGDTSNFQELNPDLPALEPSTPTASADESNDESTNPSFELLSDSPTPEERKKSKSPEKSVAEKNPKTVLDLTKESGSNGKKNKDMKVQFKLAEGKCMPSVADLRKLAEKFNVKFNEMRQAVEAAERMRRSIFVSGLPSCYTREEVKKLINDLKRRIDRKTKVSSRELDITLKMLKSTGRVMIKSTKIGETGNVLKALDGMFLEPNFKLFARRDSIPQFSVPSLKALYEKIKPHLKKLYPNLVDSLAARRIQQDHISKGNASSIPSEKLNRVWGKGRVKGRTGIRPHNRPHPPIHSNSRRGHTQIKPNGHNISNPRSNTRHGGSGPSRLPRDRPPPRPASKSQLMQSNRVNGVVPQRRPQMPDRRMPNEKRRAPPLNRRAPPLNRRAPPADRRAPPVNRRAPPIDRRAPPIDRRAPPIDRRALPIDRRAAPVDRRAPPIERRPLPIDRRPLPIDRRPLPIDRRPLPIDRRQQQMAAPVNQRAGPPVTQANKWRTSRVIPNNEDGARAMGSWGEHSQESVRRANQTGDKHAILNRRSQEANGLQERRAAVSQRAPMRSPHEAPPSRDFPPSANFRERAIPQRSILQKGLTFPQRGNEIPYDYSRDTVSRQFMERNSRMPADRQLGRPQVMNSLPLEQNQGMKQRSSRNYIERMNMVPNLRDEVGYEVKRIPSALQRRNINENVPRGRIPRGGAPRGTMISRQQGQREPNRGQKRRWNEVAENNPRESLFIERRLNRGGNRPR